MINFRRVALENGQAYFRCSQHVRSQYRNTGETLSLYERFVAEVRFSLARSRRSAYALGAVRILAIYLLAFKVFPTVGDTYCSYIVIGVGLLAFIYAISIRLGLFDDELQVKSLVNSCKKWLSQELPVGVDRVEMLRALNTWCVKEWYIPWRIVPQTIVLRVLAQLTSEMIG